MLPAVVLMSACKKESTEIYPTSKANNDSTHFYLAVDNDMNSVEDDIDEAQDDNSNKRIGASCYSVSYVKDTSAPVPGFENNYRKFILTYSGSCDSLNRSGQIIVYKSGSWLTGNYRDSITFSGFSTDGRSIKGYKTRKFSKTSDLKNLVFDFSTNLEGTNSSGKAYSYKAVGKKTLVNYLLPALKYVEVTGAGVFVNAEGKQVSYAITSPIKLLKACKSKMRFPVSGSVTYNNTAANYASVVDYGNGNCDKLATISINNGAPVIFKMK